MGVKTVILCGGLGTRLREETEYRPKPMVDVGGRPILWHIMKTYSAYGYNDFVLALGYKGDAIKSYFLNYREMTNDFTICLGRTNGLLHYASGNDDDFQVTLVDTGLETMTGARVKRVERYIDGDYFLATYGDGLADIDVGKLVEFHKSHGKIATVTVTNPISRFGQIEVDNNSTVQRFVEKPREAGWASAGYFVFSRKVFEYLSDDESCVLEQAPLQKLAKDQQLVAYKHTGFFQCMDTYREYLKLNEMWQKSETPWATWRKGPAASAK